MAAPCARRCLSFEWDHAGKPSTFQTRERFYIYTWGEELHFITTLGGSTTQLHVCHIRTSLFEVDGTLNRCRSLNSKLRECIILSGTKVQYVNEHDTICGAERLNRKPLFLLGLNGFGPTHFEIRYEICRCKNQNFRDEQLSQQPVTAKIREHPFSSRTFVLIYTRTSIYPQNTGWHKKTVVTKNRITSKLLFRLTQSFSYMRSSLCSRHLQSFKSVLQKLFVSLAIKKCAPDELPGAAGAFGSGGQSSRWPSRIPPLGSLLLLLWLLPSGQG